MKKVILSFFVVMKMLILRSRAKGGYLKTICELFHSKFPEENRRALWHLGLRRGTSEECFVFRLQAVVVPSARLFSLIENGTPRYGELNGIYVSINGMPHKEYTPDYVCSIQFYSVLIVSREL